MHGVNNRNSKLPGTCSERDFTTRSIEVVLTFQFSIGTKREPVLRANPSRLATSCSRSETSLSMRERLDPMRDLFMVHRFGLSVERDVQYYSNYVGAVLY